MTPKMIKRPCRILKWIKSLSKKNNPVEISSYPEKILFYND